MVSLIDTVSMRQPEALRSSLKLIGEKRAIVMHGKLRLIEKEVPVAFDQDDPDAFGPDFVPHREHSSDVSGPQLLDPDEVLEGIPEVGDLAGPSIGRPPQQDRHVAEVAPALAKVCVRDDEPSHRFMVPRPAHGITRPTARTASSGRGRYINPRVCSALKTMKSAASQFV